MDRPSLKRSASQRDRSSRRQERIDMANAYSPLQNFVKAKKKINQIFEGIASFLGESKGFLEGSHIGDESTPKVCNFRTEVSSSHAQITSITEVLSRDHMKVVFFGRTSNGKSTVINAMLHDRILPSGIGHTTNCFLSVNGTDGQEAYMLKPDSEERQNVKSLSQLVHALCKEKLDCSSYVEVYWPKSKCALLGDDVELVDSPGIDVSPDLDKWIDDYCLDADVFVLVANAESTLMQTEKKFFYKVNEKLSRPNIFILNNRWDASASEPEMMDAVKNQHMERAVGFLVDELKCVNRLVAEDRVFFVSAKETLSSRMQKLQGMPEGGAAIHAEGFHARLMEFETFEHKFEECISKSAIKTKFEAHAIRGLKIATDIKNMMEELASIAQKQREKCMKEKGVHEDRLAYIKEQQDFCSCECKKNIKDLKVKVQQQVEDAMTDEIDRLSVLVNEFEYPFHTHHGFLQMYKRELRAHIEKGLGRNLSARCSTQLQSQIRQEQKDMARKLESLLPPESPQSSLVPAIEPNQDFTVNYQLDVDNLCSDFIEDIEFHFSLGWSNLIRKYLAPHNSRLAIALGANLTRNYGAHHLRSVDEKRDMEVAVKPQSSAPEVAHSYEEDEIALAVVKAMSSLTSQTAYGFVIVAGLVWRAVGWKIIMFGGGLYGTLYLFERLRWNSRAKEMTFKRQFVEYSTEKLQLIISLTSSNCAHQVQQELVSTFTRLCSLVDRAKENLQEQILDLDSEITRLESIEDKAKILRNKAVWLEKELSDFVKEFGLSRSKI